MIYGLYVLSMLVGILFTLLTKSVKPIWVVDNTTIMKLLTLLINTIIIIIDAKVHVLLTKRSFIIIRRRLLYWNVY